MKLYPYDLPAGVHPNMWWLLGLGLTKEQMGRVIRHLCDDLGVRLDTTRGEVSFSWAVGVDAPGRDRTEVGDEIDVVISERGAVHIVDGGPPPGARLEKHSGRIRGTLTHPGLYSVTVRIGPKVKYDPLGSPGGPDDPGVWIPVDQPRQVPDARLERIPLSVAELSDLDKDHALAELLAWRDGVTIREADRGN